MNTPWVTGAPTTPQPTPTGRVRAKGKGKGWLGWKVWMRTVHLYTSLVGLVFALFFGVTGFVLHHGDALGLGAKHQVHEEGQLTAGLEPVDELTVVEALRSQFGITAPVTEFQADPDQLFVRFARPGEDVDAVVMLPDGAVEVDRERGGVLDALTDLHKGDRSGALGGLLVDAAAVLLIVFSLTGFALWLSLPKRRKTGLVALGLTLALVLAAGAKLLL